MVTKIKTTPRQVKDVVRHFNGCAKLLRSVEITDIDRGLDNASLSYSILVSLPSSDTIEIPDILWDIASDL